MGSVYYDNIMAKQRGIKSKKSTTELNNTVAEESIEQPRPKLFSLKNIIIAGLLILFVLIWKFKGYFIAATVNGQPISRFELNNQLLKRFGDQTLDNMVNERLILAAIRQKGVFISKEEIDTRVKQIEEKLTGAISLSEALKAQGLTSDEFRKQIEIQLSISKLFDKEATVSTTEVEDYISKNSQTYKNATDPVALREDVTNMLRQQKTGDLFNNWFTDIQKKATVKKFISAN